MLEEGSYCGVEFKDDSYLSVLPPPLPEPDPLLFPPLSSSSSLLLPLPLMYTSNLKPKPDKAELEAPDFFIGDFLGEDPDDAFFSAFFSLF